jgi:uncharacterized protein YggE
VQTITATGTGVVAVVPDSAVVRLAALARGSGVAEAYAAMAAAAATVVEVAHRHTEERRVASTGISVWPARDHEGRETGYEARHSYAVTCPDLATAGALLDELAGQVGDALAVDGVALEVTEDHGAGDRAREAAFHDARERATQLARMAGAGLGAVQTIVEGDPDRGPSPMPRMALASASAAGLEPGEASVTTTVTVVWELAY